MAERLIEAMARAIADGLADFASEPRPTDAEWRGEPMQEAREMFGIQARAALTAISEAGYAVVPVEPTEAMIDAGNNALCDNGVDSVADDDAPSCYRAMLKAADITKGNTNG